jgi:hypothetical protein
MQPYLPIPHHNYPSTNILLPANNSLWTDHSLAYIFVSTTKRNEKDSSTKAACDSDNSLLLSIVTELIHHWDSNITH